MVGTCFGSDWCLLVYPSSARSVATQCCLFVGCLRKASCIGNSRQKVTSGAWGSCCGRSSHTANSPGTSCPTMRCVVDWVRPPEGQDQELSLGCKLEHNLIWLCWGSHLLNGLLCTEVSWAKYSHSPSGKALEEEKHSSCWHACDPLAMRPRNHCVLLI